MIELQNFVIQGYFGIDEENLWTIVKEHLQQDKAATRSD
jgi:uncharacterized protein with HEPN domain